jgi:hypothetical protein
MTVLMVDGETDVAALFRRLKAQLRPLPSSVE